MWQTGHNQYHEKSVLMRKLKGGYGKVWNKGLTKHTHPSLLSASKKQTGKNNSIFNAPDWRDKVMIGGLATRKSYRGSIFNKSPKNRRQFSTSQDRLLFERAGNRCEYCGTTKYSKVNPLESDHIVPVALGGETTLENGQVLCNLCHLFKTALDKKVILDERKLAKI